GFASTSLMITFERGSGTTGSAKPGDPPANELAAHARGSFSPYEGRASTREGPQPSAASGHGVRSLYSTSSRMAPWGLRSRTNPSPFGSSPFQPPSTPSIPYTARTSAGLAATTTYPPAGST